MKIIDVDTRGNVVRFYLGENTKDWGWTNKDWTDYSGRTPGWLKPSARFFGDDWDDPIENAGKVYDEFIKGHKDIAYSFDDMVFAANDFDYGPVSITKDELALRKYPCLVVIKSAYFTNHDWLGMWVLYDIILHYKDLDLTDPNVEVYFFGDEMPE